MIIVNILIVETKVTCLKEMLPSTTDTQKPNHVKIVAETITCCTKTVLASTAIS